MGFFPIIDAEVGQAFRAKKKAAPGRTGAAFSFSEA